MALFGLLTKKESNARIDELEERLMTVFDDLVAKMAAIQAGLDAIAGDIQSLKDIIANAGTGGLSAAETEQVGLLAQGILDRVTAIDASTP